MPNLSLTKVAMGCRDFDMLAQRVRSRASGGVLRVPTRMRPRRADELVGGNLYWIVRHRLVGCNAILGIADRDDGRVDIVCSAELERIAPVHKRAHQGWRYYESGSLSEQEDGSGLSALPPPLYGRLAALALV